MVPHITVRSFTNDQYILDKVFYSNHYKLKGHHGPDGPVVVDLGAHCGYFTFAAISLGASKVYSFEPFPENFRILLKNTEHTEVGKVIPYQVGVYTENTTLSISYPKIMEEIYYDFANLAIEEEVPPQFKAPCFALDYILNRFISEPVDILKLNIGYAELDILLSSELLPSKVKSIVVETSDPTEKIEGFTEKMKSKGFIESALSPVDDEGKVVLILSKDKISQNFTVEP